MKLGLLLGLDLLNLAFEVGAQIPSALRAVFACRVLHDLLGSRSFVDMWFESDSHHLLVLSILLTLQLSFLPPLLYLLCLCVKLLKGWLLLLSFRCVAASLFEDLLSAL